MKASHLTPALIWRCAILVWLAALITTGGAQLNWWHVPANGIRLVFSLFAALAYVAGLILSWNIAGEHRDSPRMRTAWLLLGASAFFSVLRHLALAAVSFDMRSGPDSLASYLVTQSMMVLSLVFLAVGLFFIWRTFSLLDLGFSPHKIDVGLFVLIVLLIPPILLSDSFARPQPDHSVVPVFRYAGAILLPVSTGMAVQLHRVALRMKGGAMAKALQILAVFTGGRLLLMMLNSVPGFRADPLMSNLIQAAWQGLPFLFPLAAAYRWQITVRARSAVAEMERMADAIATR